MFGASWETQQRIEAKGISSFKATSSMDHIFFVPNLGSCGTYNSLYNSCIGYIGL